MKITQATDWNNVHTQLRSDLSKLGYNPDLHRMLNNITNMVTELSNLEVTARRIHKPEYTVEKVNEINKAIDHLEKLIVMAQLML